MGHPQIPRSGCSSLATRRNWLKCEDEILLLRGGKGTHPPSCVNPTQRSLETGEGCSQAVWSMNYSPPVSGQVAHITANHHVDNVLGNIGSMIANAFQIFCY